MEQNWKRTEGFQHLSHPTAATTFFYSPHLNTPQRGKTVELGNVLNKIIGGFELDCSYSLSKYFPESSQFFSFPTQVLEEKGNTFRTRISQRQK